MTVSDQIDGLLSSNTVAAQELCEKTLASPTASKAERIHANVRLAHIRVLLGDVDAGYAIAQETHLDTLHLAEARLLASSYNEIGVQLYCRKEFLKAIQLYDKALLLIDSLGVPTKEKTRILANKGDALTRINSNELAIIHYEQALEFARQENDKQLTAMLLGNLALLARAQQSVSEIEKQYLDESLDLFTSLGDIIGQCNILGHLARWHRSRNEPGVARTMCEQVVALSESQGLDIPAVILFHLACACGITGDVDAASAWLRQFEARVGELPTNELQGDLEVVRGHLAGGQQRSADAIRHFELALDAYLITSLLPQACDVANELIVHCKREGDHKRLCKYLTLLMDFRVRLRNTAVQRQLEVLSATNEVETTRQQAELERLRNIELQDVHSSLMRASFQKDRLLENCAVRLSMPLEMVSDILDESKLAEFGVLRQSMNDIQGILEVALGDVADILLAGQSNMGKASLQSIGGVLEFVQRETNLRLREQSSSLRWEQDIGAIANRSVHAARLHSLVTRCLEMFETLSVGSVLVSFKWTSSTGSSLRMTCNVQGTLRYDAKTIDTVIDQQIGQGSQATMPERRLALSWMALKYSAGRLDALPSASIQSKREVRVDVEIPLVDSL